MRYRLGPWRVDVSSSGPLPAGVRFLKQAHGALVVPAAGVRQLMTAADGMIVRPTDPPCGLITSDCLSMIVAAHDRAILLHVSRKSLAAGLLDPLHRYIPLPKIRGVYLGPHVCSQHLTFVDPDDQVRTFAERYPGAAYQDKAGVLHLSLRRAVQLHLDRWEVEPDMVCEDSRCTWEDPLLPSARRIFGRPMTLGLQLVTTIARLPQAGRAPWRIVVLDESKEIAGA